MLSRSIDLDHLMTIALLLKAGANQVIDLTMSRVKDGAIVTVREHYDYLVASYGKYYG